MRHSIFKQLTVAQYDQLIKNGSPDNWGKDHIPVVKLFMPGTGHTWLLTEIDPEETNIAFGLCDLGMGFPELGYGDLDEIGSVKNRLGLGIERDTSFEGEYPMSVYADAARECRQITEDDARLKRYVNKPCPKIS